MHNRLQHITVHYAGGRHHGNPCCRPHWRHMCHAQAFFGKHLLVFVEVCCRFVFCRPSICNHWHSFCQACLQRVIEEKILPFTMHNRLQRSTVHYAGGRHHGNPCCRPHWRHMCHAQAFFGKHLLVFVEVCCRFVVFCWPSICNHWHSFCQACLQRVIEEKILPFTMHNRLQCSTVHYAGGRHHGNPRCRPHWRHMCHARAFFGKHLLVFVEVCCRFVFCWPSICNHWHSFCQACLQRVIEEKILPFTMHNRLQRSTVHYAGGRHHGNPCCRPHWRHMCHAQAFFGKHLLVFVELCCRFVVFCWPSICNHWHSFCQACLQRVIEEKILPFTMHNRLQRSTVHYAGGRHHGNPCCRPHWRHICHAQAFFGKHLLVFVEVCCGFVFCWPSICNHWHSFCQACLQRVIEEKILPFTMHNRLQRSTVHYAGGRHCTTHLGGNVRCCPRFRSK